jgi:hypothetical protein
MLSSKLGFQGCSGSSSSSWTNLRPTLSSMHAHGSIVCPDAQEETKQNFRRYSTYLYLFRKTMCPPKKSWRGKASRDLTEIIENIERVVPIVSDYNRTQTNCIPAVTIDNPLTKLQILHDSITKPTTTNTTFMHIFTHRTLPPPPPPPNTPRCRCVVEGKKKWQKNRKKGTRSNKKYVT